MPVPVSLIITVYNRDRFLAAAIESILRQIYTDFELLVWDDGSTDKSVEIASRYAEQDKRMRVVAAPHAGRGPALQEAISLTACAPRTAATKGKYLGWVDSDDLLHSQALAATTTVLDQQPDVGMVYTDYLVIDEQGQVKGLGSRCQIPYSPERLLVDFMTFHFRLMRRSIYEAVGGIDSTFSAAGDYDLCLRLSEATQIHHLNEPLYLYRNHQNNISHQSQLEQIHFTALAIQKALQRRSLTDTLELEVKVRPQYVLRKKGNKKPKVFGIGLGKTGTTSLGEALEHLGYSTIHLPIRGREIEAHEAAVDTSVALAYQELDRRYPGSKFILTVRDVDQWLTSWREHDVKLRSALGGELPDWLQQLRQKAFGSWQFNPEVWRAAYLRHLQAVRTYFKERPEDLLVLDICAGQGWNELCPFLSQPIPRLAFPHRNKHSDPLTLPSMVSSANAIS